MASTASALKSGASDPLVFVASYSDANCLAHAIKGTVAKHSIRVSERFELTTGS